MGVCVHIRTRFHHYSSYGTRDSSCINGEMFSGTVATVGRRAATSLFPLMVDASFLVRRCCCRLGCSHSNGFPVERIEGSGARAPSQDDNDDDERTGRAD